jgi:8-oxo-dGTP diphosphatase
VQHEFLSHRPRPSVTVDTVVLTLLEGKLQVLLVVRGAPPFQGASALPGGFVVVGSGGKGGESLDDAAARELVEETGLSRAQVLLDQVGAFGTPGRDPRGRVITVAYFALVRPELAGFVRAGSDAAAAAWAPVSALPPLAFDHARIIDATLARMRRDIDRGPLALHLAPATFTITELRAVHEALHGRALDAGNFRRRFLKLVESGVVEPASGKRVTAKKPARVWRSTSTSSGRR